MEEEHTRWNMKTSIWYVTCCLLPKYGSITLRTDLHAFLPAYPEVTACQEAGHSMSGQGMNPPLQPQLGHDGIDPRESCLALWRIKQKYTIHSTPDTWPLNKKQDRACSGSAWIHPSSRSWVMMASIHGNPVSPCEKYKRNGFHNTLFIRPLTLDLRTKSRTEHFWPGCQGGGGGGSTTPAAAGLWWHQSVGIILILRKPRT